MKLTLNIVMLSFVALSGCEEKKAPAPAPATAPLAATTVAHAPEGATAPVAAPGEPPLIPVGTKMKCPVSGEEFTVKAKTVQLVHEGKRYAFCCADCPNDFKKDPAKYAAKN